MTGAPPTLVPAPDDTSWDRLNDESPQGSVFTTSTFLAAVCPDAERWFIVEDEHIVAGVPVLIRDGTAATAPYLYTPYHGLLLSKEFSMQPGHRRIPRTVRLSTAVLEALCERYRQFWLSLHPTFNDVRGFQWFHYGEHTKLQATLAVRYTGLIQLDVDETFETYLSRTRRVRRYEFCRANRSGLRIRESSQPSILMEMLEETFGRQGLHVEAREQEAISKICAAFLGSGAGYLAVAEAPDGKILAATLFLEHCGTLYYLLGATRTEARDAGANTLLFLGSVEQALRRGVRRVDVVGVNSPNRGDFKTSLGAEPVPYFVVAVG
jgi:hypothetical protein